MNLRNIALFGIAALGLTLSVAQAQPKGKAKGAAAGQGQPPAQAKGGILGLNTTKKDPAVPLGAVLEEPEAGSSAPASGPASTAPAIRK